MAAMFLVSPSYAQEAPDASPEAPDASPEAPDEQDTQDTGTRLFLEIEAPGGEPVDKGDTFIVQVMVADVENLSGFSYEIGFDPERIRPVTREDQDVAPPTPFGGTPVPGSEDDDIGNIIVEGETGQMIADSPRNSLCIGPFVQSLSAGVVTAGCAGVSLPACLGGPSGISGSGTLGTVVFESRGGEMADITLVSPVLTSDDAEPPCEEDGELRPVTIESSSGPPVTVLLSGGGSSSSVLLIVIIAVVVVAVLGAGLGGYLLYQRRDASSAASD